jgi:hypothetical protein
MIDTCPYVHPPDVMGYQDAFGSGAAPTWHSVSGHVLIGGFSWLQP